MAQQFDKGKGSNWKETPMGSSKGPSEPCPSPYDNKGFMAALRLLTQAGGWFSLVGTRDGGAIKLTFIFNDVRRDTYVSNTQEMDAVALALRNLVSAG